MAYNSNWSALSGPQSQIWLCSQCQAEDVSMHGTLTALIMISD
jgi:hypothetical protein